MQYIAPIYNLMIFDKCARPIATTTGRVQSISVTPTRSLVPFCSQPLALQSKTCVSRSQGTSPLPGPLGFLLSVDPNDQKKTACYDIDVEVDDTLKTQMNSFLLSTASQQEIATLDNKVGIMAWIVGCHQPSITASWLL